MATRTKPYNKHAFPVEQARRFLEPGPVVLLSAAYKEQRSIMTMGWHMIMMDDPSYLGCFIWDQNDSYDIVRRSKECVINLPTADLAKTVVGIGNTHSSKIDKFTKFALTPIVAHNINAPLIAECYANFECKLIDKSLIRKFSIFVFEVVKAHVAKSPKYPATMHYRGDGIFMIAGRNVSYRKLFKAQNL